MFSISQAIAFVAALILSATAVAQSSRPAVVWQQVVTTDRQISLAFGPGAIDSKGNVFVLGTEYPQIGAAGCMFVAKFAAATGEQQWWKTFCGDSGSTAFMLGVDSSDNVIVAGVSAFLTPARRVRTIKLTNEGGVLWDNLFDAGPTSQNVVSLAIDQAGNVVVLVAVGPSSLGIASYSPTGSLRWNQLLPMYNGRIGIHPGGDVFVSGSELRDGTQYWTLARLASADGFARWSNSQNYGSSAAAIAIDGAGDPISAGWRGVSPNRTMLTMKQSGADGSILWRRELDTPGDDTASALVVDSNNDVVVGGSDGHMRTIRYAGSDGAPIWANSFAGTENGDGVRSVAIDPSGDVVVTGFANSDGSTFPNSAMRTVKYSGRGGVALWSVGYSDLGGRTPVEGRAVLPVSDGVNVIARKGSDGFYVVKYGLSTVPVQSLQGLWWNSPSGSESGWGINIAHQGEGLFLTWFTYETNGAPIWFVMPNVKNAFGETYKGRAYRAKGPVSPSPVFDPSQVVLRDVGGVSVTSIDATHLRFVYDTYARDLTRLEFSSPASECSLAGESGTTANYQDLWWAAPPGSESGWGLNLAQQGDTLFATWFTYNSAGQDIWYVASDLVRRPDGSYAGSLDRTTGPYYNTKPWNSSLVQRIPAGNMTLSFTDANTGIFTYTVNNVTQQKAITRLSFGSPASTCH